MGVSIPVQVLLCCHCFYLHTSLINVCFLLDNTHQSIRECKGSSTESGISRANSRILDMDSSLETTLYINHFEMFFFLFKDKNTWFFEIDVGKALEH